MGSLWGLVPNSTYVRSIWIQKYRKNSIILSKYPADMMMYMNPPMGSGTLIRWVNRAKPLFTPLFSKMVIMVIHGSEVLLKCIGSCPEWENHIGEDNIVLNLSGEYEVLDRAFKYRVQ